MGELAIIPQTGTAIAQPVIEFSIRDMERMAMAFAQSGLFGVKTRDQALALCLIAHAEGRHPALAARDYDVIQGRPAKKAEAMQRDFIASGGKIEWLELTDTRAEATFSHPAGGTVTIDWDLKRATTAGLGGKDMWKKFPRNMLRARVVSEGVRTVMPMATSGMYVPEEIRDFDEEPKPARAVKTAADVAPTPRDDAAAKWTDGFIAEVRMCITVEDVDALAEKRAKRLDELAEKRPELHAEALARMAEQRASLEPDADTAPAAEWEP